MAFIRTSKKKKTKQNATIEGKFKLPDYILSYAEKHGIDVSPLDVVGLARSLEIKLRYEAMDEEDSGRLEKNKEGNWYMHINSLHHPNRQRFTIAHELGHRFLHGDQQSEFADKIFFRNGEQSLMETEANKYAASLLMSQDSFKEFISNTSSKVEDIAKYFGVSSLAVRFRAKTLGYSGHGV